MDQSAVDWNADANGEERLMNDFSRRVQAYEGVDSAAEALAKGYDLCEVKDDGWWCRLVVKDRVGVGHTRDGEAKFTKAADVPDGVYVGEYLFGTNRSEKEVDGKKGDLKLFDLLVMGDQDISHMPYMDRRKALKVVLAMNENAGWIKWSPFWPTSRAATVWQQFVVEGGSEGMVYKKSSDPYVGSVVLRQKVEFTMDYVIMGVAEGAGANKGKVGALLCGLYVDGVLVQKCRVGGGMYKTEREDWFKDPSLVVGRVVEVMGWQIFDTGAMRHPNMLHNPDNSPRFRTDKRPEECTWAK